MSFRLDIKYLCFSRFLQDKKKIWLTVPSLFFSILLSVLSPDPPGTDNQNVVQTRH